MTIYVHSTEKSLVSKFLFPSFYEIKFFKTHFDLHEEYFNSERTFIFCIDDQFIIDEIASHCKRTLIISSKFLISHFKKYKLIYSSSILGNIMKTWKVHLIGFEDEDDDLIIDLQFKIIIMGGSMSTDPDDVTHLVVYKMHEKAHGQIFKTFSDCSNVFNVHYIEFFWKKCSLLISTYDILDNLQETFAVRYFQNCKMHLIGFDEYQLGEMLLCIFDNGGSIYQLDHLHSPDCIFIVPNNSKSENVQRVINEESKDSMKNVVTEDWFWQSVENQYLVKFDDYRVLLSKTIGENTNYLSPPNDVKKSASQVLNDFKTVKLQPSGNPNQNPPFSFSDKEISVDEIKANYNLGFGFYPSQCSKEKCEEYEYRRYNLLLNLVKNIKDKLDVLNNFQAIRTHKLIENSNLLLIFNIFKQITDFFQGFYDIFQPLVINYSIDCCIGMELLPHYNQLKKYFQTYNSKFNQMSDLIDRIDSNAVKEHIQHFVDSNEISSFKYFIEIPKRMLTLIQMQFDDIIKSTSKFHPDIVFFIEISQKNRHVTKLIETLEDKLIEGRNQIIVMKCIGNPAIVQIGNRYRTVVDCMHYCDDGLKCAKSLFLFDNTIVMCNFKASAPGKLFDRVIAHLKEQINSGNNLTRCPSIQSIYRNSPFIEMNIKRKKSISSVTTVNSISVRKLEGNACSKFHKLFTGLSKLNWKENPENIYSETEILEKSSLISLISHRGNFDVQSQMFFTINYIDKQSNLLKNMKLFLVPRVVKHPFKYNKINVALPTDFDWEYNDNKGIKWDEFIVEEKRNFCAIIAQHYEMEFIEDSLLSNSVSSVGFENDWLVSDKYFRTPVKLDKTTTRNLSPSNNSFMGSFKKSPKSMSLKKTITENFRRFTRFKKRSKNTLPSSSSQNYIFEDESQNKETKETLTNHKYPENSPVKSLEETEEFSSLNQSELDRNSPLFSKENITFPPNSISNQEKTRESRKPMNNNNNKCNSFIYIDESPTRHVLSSPIDFNCSSLTQTPIENNTSKCSKEADSPPTIGGDPINPIKRAANKRRSESGSNIQIKNRKF